MCIGDWRLGRLIRTQITSVSLATTVSTPILPSFQRVGIQIGAFIPPSILAASLRIDSGGVGIASLTNGTTFWLATIATHGDLPTKPFTVTSNGATLQVGIVEMFMPEEYLQAGIDEFKRMLSEFGSR